MFTETVASVLVFPALVYFTSELHIGVAPSIRGARKLLLATWQKLLALCMVICIAWFGIGELVFSLPGVGQVQAGTTIEWYVTRASGMLRVIELYAVYLAVGWLCFAFPALMLERRNVRGAFSRGWRLAEPRFEWILMIWTLRFAAGWMIQLPLSLFTLWASRTHPGFFYGNAVLEPIYEFIPAMTASVLCRPIFAIAITLIYYDQRIRLEGFDIELMMRDAGLTLPVPARRVEKAGDTSPHKEMPA